MKALSGYMTPWLTAHGSVSPAQNSPAGSGWGGGFRKHLQDVQQLVHRLHDPSDSVTPADLEAHRPQHLRHLVPPRLPPMASVRPLQWSQSQAMLGPRASPTLTLAPATKSGNGMTATWPGGVRNSTSLRGSAHVVLIRLQLALSVDQRPLQVRHVVDALVQHQHAALHERRLFARWRTDC